MSKYQTINELNIEDQAMLVETLLKDVKYRQSVLGIEVESHEQAQHLFGVGDDQRPETAEVIIRRRYVGGAANDIGFKRQENGNFRPIISEFDAHYYNQGWLDGLSQGYAVRKYIGEMEQQGFGLVSRGVDARGEVDLQFNEYGGLG